MISRPLAGDTFADLFHESRIFLFDDAANVLESLLDKHVHLLALHDSMRNISLDVFWLALCKPQDEKIICPELTVLLEVKESCLLEIIENQFGLVNILTHICYHLLEDVNRLHVLNHELLFLPHDRKLLLVHTKML